MDCGFQSPGLLLSLSREGRLIEFEKKIESLSWGDELGKKKGKKGERVRNSLSK